ncbi:diguanylate cyclase [Pelobacter propionicus]|uniref:diguanylate cyclase n=1 Tax=Pelobacter propionicus (strain DSM 2379 / NBRC 103807 / OttBd1) TaxID=338966 RepID=A1ANP1_PELPD|nr:diguanylate cyclase [Pelobacter propionicus]ABK98961.1 response regulator receiver modulated diguanylate cyclase [Pelobacter propionicus DSM 2379]
MTSDISSPSEPQAASAPEPLPRLLIVDDEPTNIQSLYEIFRSDHEVFIATSALQGLEMCDTNPPDLIMLDIVMPSMNGLEMCRQLKSDQRTRDIPVIFVTAYGNPEEETRGLEAGAVDFIMKPFNSAVVRARVQTHLTMKAQADLLRSMAFIDGLTGVANRRRFDESLEAEWRQCRRHRAPLALLMIDIDHFKKYNDSYGHQEGDVCLRKIATLLREELGRPHDLVARYGGEEFACLLPGVDMEGAMYKAQSILTALHRQAIPHVSSETAPFVTISLGVAVTSPGPEPRHGQLVATADTQLYKAKQQGRNRICGQEVTD